MKPASFSLLAILLTSALTGCDSAESAIQPSPVVRPVKLMTIEDMAQAQLRVFPAKIAASQQADLAFRIHGELVQLDLSEGQYVKKGQLLAKLDDRDAKNALLNAEASHELAAVDYDRKKELFARKLISKAEYDTARATLKSARAALNTARDQLAYTRLEAPFSGTVARVNLDNHQMIQATQKVLTLQGNSQLDVSIQVPESLLLSLKNNSFDDTFNPKVRFQAPKTLAIESGFTPTVLTSGTVMTYPVQYKEHASTVSQGTQTYEVVFSLIPPKDLNILPGMSAELMLDMTAHQGERQAITVLPLSAIVRSDNEQITSVWRYNAESGKLDSVPVTVGQLRANGIEVLSGLTPGDEIVEVGANALKDNMTVKPLRWERGV